MDTETFYFLWNNLLLVGAYRWERVNKGTETHARLRSSTHAIYEIETYTDANGETFQRYKMENGARVKAARYADAVELTRAEYDERREQKRAFAEKVRADLAVLRQQRAHARAQIMDSVVAKLTAPTYTPLDEQEAAELKSVWQSQNHP